MDFTKGPNGSLLHPPGSDPVPVEFPTFHYEGPEELPIPPHGTMVVHYRQIKSVETKTPAGHWYSCDVELKKIISVEKAKEDEAPSRRDTSTEDALDELARQREEEENE